MKTNALALDTSASRFSRQTPLPVKLLTPQETADLLGTTPGVLSVWRSTNRYNLKYIKIGKSVRYRLEDIQAFIESRTVSPAEV